MLLFLMCSRSTLRHADRNETRQQNSRVPEISCETNGSVGNGKLSPKDLYTLTGFEFFCLCGIRKTFLVTFCTKATVFSSVQKADFIGLLKREAGSCGKKLFLLCLGTVIDISGTNQTSAQTLQSPVLAFTIASAQFIKCHRNRKQQPVETQILVGTPGQKV